MPEAGLTDDPLVRDAVQRDAARIAQRAALSALTQRAGQQEQGLLESALRRCGQIRVQLLVRRPWVRAAEALRDSIEEDEPAVDEVEELGHGDDGGPVWSEAHYLARTFERVAEDLHCDRAEHPAQAREQRHSAVFTVPKPAATRREVLEQRHDIRAGGGISGRHLPVVFPRRCTGYLPLAPGQIRDG